MLIIGLNPVLETLDFDSDRIEKILFLEGIDNSKINKISEIASRKKIPTERKSRAEFDKLIDKKDKSEGISQGVIAIAREFEYSSLFTLLKELKDAKDALIVVLDEIQDPHNLGAIIRTASAAGVDAVVISEKNSAKVNHTVVKTSSGATNYIKICMESNIYNAINALKESGFIIVGTLLKSEKSHFSLSYSGKTAVLFGSEGKGLRSNLIRLCDEVVKIPITGKTESLNVSVSAGVMLYEILRQRLP